MTLARWAAHATHVALAVALAACSRGPETAPTPLAAAPGEGGIAHDAPAGVAAASVIPPATRQLVTGVIADWSATTVTLRRWRRDDAATWIADGDAWKGVIGRGAGWGSGLHGSGAPAGRVGPAKREGDGKSPAGAFALRAAYGYAGKPPTGTALPYTQVTPSWQCVDDPRSRFYTRILDWTTVQFDWTSAEAMRRRDELYTWVIDVAHNPGATPGAGSCIFFHVWRSAADPTVGCTAMPEPALAAMLANLDPTAVYVLLPRAEYDAFTGSWGLPPIEK